LFTLLRVCFSRRDDSDCVWVSIGVTNHQDTAEAVHAQGQKTLLAMCRVFVSYCFGTMKYKNLVIPAQAGIQYRRAIADWTPAFAGVTSSDITLPDQ